MSILTVSASSQPPIWHQRAGGVKRLVPGALAIKDIRAQACRAEARQMANPGGGADLRLIAPLA